MSISHWGIFPGVFWKPGVWSPTTWEVYCGEWQEGPFLHEGQASPLWADYDRLRYLARRQ
jgi:hypothetical protein